MKKIILSIMTFALLFASCDKSTLELTNPNEPGLDVLTTEVGMSKAATGVYNSLRYVEGYYYIWFVLTNHNMMGDATAVSAGNFGWRWANQVSSITLSDGTKINPPTGGSQPTELDDRNSRDFGADNLYAHEWIPTYSLIAHCNLMLKNIDDASFSGSEEVVAVKKNTYKAWFLWWKGFAYSRIGSIYEKALIVNEFGELSTNYVGSSEIIAEAAKNFNASKAILATIPEDDANYLAIIGAVIPIQMQAGNGGVITPGAFIRNINTYLARNILVNKYASELTSAELSEIKTLTANGIKSDDKIFTVKSTDNDNTCLVYISAWSPYRLLAGWENLSERLVQDFKPGDARYTRNVKPLATPNYNPRGRGLSYGTRYTFNPIESGGDYATLKPSLAEIPLATTYEENLLMLAEAEIRGGDIEVGLGYIDAVRAHQNAGLAAVKGTSLNKAQALEELRRERRIGLFNKNTAFYDARRWGVLKPVAQGGGRTNSVVVINAAGTVDENCTIDYNYKEWFPVPANETDFNPVQ
jgi:starch-binding outer membrane protein, SusD/RagB family